MDKIFLAASTLCFFGGFLYAAYGLRSGRHHPSWANLAVIAAGFVFQSLTLHLRGQLHSRCPVTNGAEILVFLSWSTVLLYFVLGRGFRLSLLGMFTAPMVFVFQAIALVALATGDPGPKRLEGPADPWRELHIAVALLSFGAFALGAIAGVMYLVQDRQLKKHQLGPLFYNLPPIRSLIDAIVRLTAIGLALLTVGIGSAVMMTERPAAAHFGLAALVWAGYVAMLGLHAGKKIGPKRTAALAIGVFLLPLVMLAAG